MSLAGVRALTFDTGGTILDWHSGIKGALAETGATHRLHILTVPPRRDSLTMLGKTNCAHESVRFSPLQESTPWNWRDDR